MSSPEDDALPGTRAERMGWAYSVADHPDRVRARFDAWAGVYDDDVIDGAGWNGPAAAVRAALEHVPRAAEILDAGAGTGLVGEKLAKAGYTTIDATDISPGMLSQAVAKGVYRTIFEADLKAALPLADATYDAVLAIGVSGYIHPETLSEFARILRPKGHVIYTISNRHYADHGFADETEKLVASKVVVSLDVGADFASLPSQNPDHQTQIRVLRRC